MASLNDWPDYLPGPLISNFDDSAKPFERRIPMSEGPDRVRRMSLKIPKQFSVSFNLTSQQFYLLENFYESILEGGTLFFNLEIDDNAGSIVSSTKRCVRFINGFKGNKISDDRYEVRAGLESFEDEPIVANRVGINLFPIARAGADQSGIIAGARVTLDGSGSNDPDGSIVSYAWTQTSRINSFTTRCQYCHTRV